MAARAVGRLASVLAAALAIQALLPSWTHAAPVTQSIGAFDVKFYNSGDVYVDSAGTAYTGTQDWTAAQIDDVAAAIAVYAHRFSNRPGRQVNLYLMWDDAALYLLALVTDDSVAAPDPRQPTFAWKGDGIIFELGPDKRQLGPAELARKTDAYYVFGVTQGRAPLVAILRPNDRRTSFDILDKGRTTIAAAMARTADGYVLEARIPWQASNLNGAAAGAVFAANVEVTERKPGSFDNLGMMGTNEQRRLTAVRAHPAYWQDLELLP